MLSPSHHCLQAKPSFIDSFDSTNLHTMCIIKALVIKASFNLKLFLSVASIGGTSSCI